MRNKVTHVAPLDRFHLSVRALGGLFESEVEAMIRPYTRDPERTLLVWRQGYPLVNPLSRLTAVVLRGREAEETRTIARLWAELLRTPAPSTRASS
jgi:hypothetical protein